MHYLLVIFGRTLLTFVRCAQETLRGKGLEPWSLCGLRRLALAGRMARIALSAVCVMTRGKVERGDREPVGRDNGLADAGHPLSGATAGNKGLPTKTDPETAVDAIAGGIAGTNLTFRLVNGSEEDYRTGVYLAREAHRNTIFRDILFSADKASATIYRAMAQPDRNGLIYAAPGSDASLAEDGLYGFASVHAGEYFLGTGTLIATVQTLNISQKLSGTSLGGKFALRLVQAVRRWARTRNCEHLLVHVINGMGVEDADKFFRRCGLKTIGGKHVVRCG